MSDGYRESADSWARAPSRTVSVRAVGMERGRGLGPRDRLKAPPPLRALGSVAVHPVTQTADQQFGSNENGNEGDGADKRDGPSDGLRR